MKVIFAGGGTGGHLYPGLAIARALRRLMPESEILFIGARRGIERDVLPTSDFAFELLELHPLYRTRPWRNATTATSAFGAWRRLGEIFSATKPDIVVGTGGYAAALVLARARRNSVTYVLQEQNSVPGLTMRLFSSGARDIYLGFPEATRQLKGGKRTRFLDTGNPVEPPPDVRPSRPDLLRRWELPSNAGHVLLVTGGSQGAAPLNAAVAECVKLLTSANICVIWGTGVAHYSKFLHLNSDKCKVLPYLSPIADAYAVATAAICRAGAITTAELCCWGVPSILVPLPSAASDHQSHNARALEAAGCSELFLQTDLSGATLFHRVQRLLGDQNRLAAMADAARNRARPAAAEVIAKYIVTASDIR